MVSQITIQNFGLIDTLSIECTGALTILTGETGAGKSIIIDALRYALGERLHAAQIRQPDKPCMVEVLFDLSPSLLKEHSVFADYLPDEETTLIINRTTLPDGKNRIKVNGTALTVAQLKELGNHPIDFHGPHDHQSLLSPECHIAIIDRLSSVQELLDTYAHTYTAFVTMKLFFISIIK